MDDTGKPTEEPQQIDGAAAALPQQPDASEDSREKGQPAQPTPESAFQSACEFASTVQPASELQPVLALQPESVPAAQPTPEPVPQPVMPTQPCGEAAAQPIAQPQQQAGSPKAVPALVCGIAGLALQFVPLPLVGIVGLVLGVVAIVLGAKHTRRFGKDGKATAAKVCGVLAIAAYVVIFLVGVVLGIVSLQGFGDRDAAGDAPRSDAPPAVTAPVAPPTDALDDLTAENDAARAIVEARVDGFLAGSGADFEAFAATVGEGFELFAGFTMEEVGIDPADYARWVVTNSTCEGIDAYAYDDTGSAFITVVTFDRMEFIDVLDGKLTAYVERVEPEDATTEEHREAVGALVRETMDELTATMEVMMYVDLEKVDGAWAITDESWQREVDYAFGWL